MRNTSFVSTLRARESFRCLSDFARTLDTDGIDVRLGAAQRLRSGAAFVEPGFRCPSGLLVAPNAGSAGSPQGLSAATVRILALAFVDGDTRPGTVGDCNIEVPATTV